MRRRDGRETFSKRKAPDIHAEAICKFLAIIFLFFVGNAANAAGLSISTDALLPNLELDTAYSVTLRASGGTEPYTWTVPNGDFPSGLTLDATGEIRGIPLVDRSVTSVVRVMDAKGEFSELRFRFGKIVATATDTITIGYPEAGYLTLSNDQQTLYVSAGYYVSEPNVSVISTATRNVRDIITLPFGSAFYIAMSRDGQKAYVAGGVGVEVIDLLTNQITHGISTSAIGAVSGICACAAGEKEKVYVSSRFDGLVRAIDVATNTIVATIPVGGRPIGLASSLDGSRIYVAKNSNDPAAVIDVATDKVIATIPQSHGGGGTNTADVVVSDDGKRAYFSRSLSGQISVVDIEPGSPTYNQEVNVIRTPSSWLEGMSIFPGANVLFVASYPTNEMLIIDLDSSSSTFLKTIGAAKVGRNPYDVAVQTVGGKFAYVVNVADRTVSVIDLSPLFPTAAKPTANNHPPVARSREIALMTNQGGFASNVTSASLDNGSFDPDGDPVAISVEPSTPYPVGVNTAVLTVTDPFLAEDSAVARITVVDSEPPTIVIDRFARVGYALGSCTVTAPNPFLGHHTVLDNVGVASLTNNAPRIFTSRTDVTWTVVDPSGNAATAIQTVIPEDLEPPLIIPHPTFFAWNDPGDGNDFIDDLDLPMPFISDNCRIATRDGGGLFIQQSGGPPFYPGTTLITWTTGDWPNDVDEWIPPQNLSQATQDVIVINGVRPEPSTSFPFFDSGIFSKDGNIHADNVGRFAISGDLRTNHGHIEIVNIKERLDLIGRASALGKIDFSIKNTATGSITGDLTATDKINLRGAITRVGSLTPQASLLPQTFSRAAPPTGLDDSRYPAPIKILDGNLDITGEFPITGTVYRHGNVRIRGNARITGSGAIVADGNITIEDMAQFVIPKRVFFFSARGNIEIKKIRQTSVQAFLFAPGGNIHFSDLGPVSISGALAAGGNIEINNVTSFELGLLAPPPPCRPIAKFYVSKVPSNVPVIQNGFTTVIGRTIPIVADAFDTNWPIRDVEFFVDGTSVKRDTESPYFILWTPERLGPVTFKIIARTENNFTATATVTGTVVPIPPPPLPPNLKPVVMITSPPNGALIRANKAMTVVAGAADNDGLIQKVEFFFDGVKIGEATRSPYRTATPLVASGMHSLAVIATDNRGDTARQDVSFKANAFPNVSILSPADRTLFQFGDTIVVELAASDADGRIAKVELFSGRFHHGTRTANPYRYTIPAVNVPGCTLAAIATDDSGARTLSASVRYVVNLPPKVTLAIRPSGYAVNPTEIVLEADASDPDDTISSVEFFRSGIKIGEATAAPYRLVLAHPDSGAKIFEAVAHDGRGGTARSKQASVTVVYTLVPTVRITSPADGARVAAGEVVVRADARDSDGSINRVVFFADSVSIGSDFDSPYQVTWLSKPAGDVTITAKAFDNLGASSFSSPVRLSIFPVPPVVAFITPGNDSRFVTNTTVPILVKATDADGIVDVRLFDNDSQVGVDAAVPYEFVIAGLGGGTHKLRAIAKDGRGDTGTALITIRAVTDPGVFPRAAITAPADGDDVTKPTQVTGTATSPILEFYELQSRPVEDGAVFATIARGDTNVVNATLAMLDPTLMTNGLVEVRLVAQDLLGRRAVSAPLTVNVRGGMKVGNFTLSFTDLQVPMQGIPISVTRTYNSFDKARGDFGVGWRMDVSNVKLRNTRPLSENWFGEVTPVAFFNTFDYSIRENGKHLIAVTFPDGRVERFQPIVTPTLSHSGPISNVTMTFSPMRGSRGTLVPKLSGANLNVVGAWSGPLTLFDGTFQPYNPTEFIYTSQSGEEFHFNSQGKVEKIVSLSGDQLLITEQGLTHSAGKSITFTRDAQGRITAITDPANVAQTYEYSDSGDLIRHTDRENATTTFTYDDKHNLLTITDPRGITVAANTYDDSGRLVATADANQASMQFQHNVADRTETIVDRLGRATVHEYDDRGNVMRTRDAQGNVTRRFYDDFDNMTAEIDALGNVTTHVFDDRDFMISTTDPLGNVTRFEYDAFGNVTKTTDPRGNVTRNSYTNFGQLVQTSAADGGITANEYFDNLVQGIPLPGRGPLKSTRDPMGNVTSYEYTNGFLTKMTDALGNEVTYAYNNNGDRTMETRKRTLSGGTTTENLATAFAYDGNSRLTQTANPDNSVTKVEYNALGQEKARVDALNHRTEFTYDDQGRLSRTTFHDQTYEEVTYDLEGRRKTSRDRGGRITLFEYDSLGRLFKTIRPDGKFTLTTFDSAGRVIATTDAKNKTTTFEYDSAGRRFRTTDARLNAMTFSYDSSGNQHAVTDALGHTMYFEYDSANRQVRQIFPDSTFTVTHFDLLGRRIAATDQANKTTQFGFDSAGRLVSVTDANGKTTLYFFDEVGNRIAQEDARHRITRYEFDRMGRRTKRTLPLGQTEEMTYDLGGNLKSRIDFNGKRTLFDYDVNNQLTAKTPDAFFGAPPIGFTYTPTGQRLTMTDGTGITSYVRDNLDRVASMTTPRGAIGFEYDDNSNMTRAFTFHAGGMNFTYRHDELNRLMECEDAGTGITRYTFDDIGNLKSHEYPNGAKHEYTYNDLNRLTTLSVTRAGGELLRYGYTLGPAGNRLTISEIGKSRVYTYDNIYRLTSEQISDPALTNGGGILNYTYDDVGNRTARTNIGNNPALPPTTTYGVDDNDRLNGDGADAAGSTTSADGKSFAYDFENRLISMNNGAVQLVYNGDGDLVARTEGGVTTEYVTLPGNLNPTGFSQVVEELQGGSVKRVNTFGLDLISRRDVTTNTVLYYLTDGLGSVRGVIDGATGIVTTYDYDAFGTLIRTTGNAVDNPYLFTGERYDATLGLYYLRARFMEPGRARFWSQDSFEGSDAEPMSLHKYTYAANDPVNKSDPSGEVTLLEVTIASSMAVALSVVSATAYLSYGAGKTTMDEVIIRQAFINSRNAVHVAINSLARWNDEDKNIFKSFFGKHLLSPYLEERKRTIAEGYQSILSSFSRDYTWRKANLPGAIASVIPGGEIDIIFDPLFFKQSAIGPYSRSATITHELSHEILNTDDLTGNSLSQAMGLAVTWPADAARNSYNWQFHSEIVGGY